MNPVNVQYESEISVFTSGQWKRIDPEWIIDNFSATAEVERLKLRLNQTWTAAWLLIGCALLLGLTVGFSVGRWWSWLR